MKKKILLFALVLLVAAGAIWAKGYYNDRYLVSDYYYTQIPEDEVNAESWLVDADGVRQEKGKAYDLVGYNDQGEARDVHFTKTGSAQDYYAPGTWLKLSTSETLTTGVEVVTESDVPKQALAKIQTLGTRP